jgi:hypothetical protein
VKVFSIIILQLLLYVYSYSQYGFEQKVFESACAAITDRIEILKTQNEINKLQFAFIDINNKLFIDSSKISTPEVQVFLDKYNEKELVEILNNSSIPIPLDIESITIVDTLGFFSALYSYSDGGIYFSVVKNVNDSLAVDAHCISVYAMKFEENEYVIAFALDSKKSSFLNLYFQISDDKKLELRKIRLIKSHCKM